MSNNKKQKHWSTVREFMWIYNSVAEKSLSKLTQDKNQARLRDPNTKFSLAGASVNNPKGNYNNLCPLPHFLYSWFWLTLHLLTLSSRSASCESPRLPLLLHFPSQVTSWSPPHSGQNLPSWILSSLALTASLALPPLCQRRGCMGLPASSHSHLQLSGLDSQYRVPWLHGHLRFMST